MVPGAGIEPARLAAGDFESRVELRIGAGLRAMCSGFFCQILHRRGAKNRNALAGRLESAHAAVVPLCKPFVRVLQ